MREAFSNQYMKQTKNITVQNTGGSIQSQLSQRSTQGHHLKSNSIGNQHQAQLLTNQIKAGASLPSQNQNAYLNGQSAALMIQHQIAQQTLDPSLYNLQGINNDNYIQPSIVKQAANANIYSMLAGNINTHSQQHSGATITGQHLNEPQVIGKPGVNAHHKKSNSMVNSKMGQILIKGGVTTHIVPNNASQVQQQKSQNQYIVQSQILNHQQPSQKDINSLSLSNSMIGQQNPQYMHIQSNQTSFTQQQQQLQQNDLLSYSMDYKQQQQKGYEYQQQQQTGIQQMVLIQQNPSSKVIQPTIKNEMILRDPVANIQIKKPQSAVKTHGLTSQVPAKGNSAQKITKKPQIHHARTKSDTYNNRGSLQLKPNQPQSQLTTKRQASGVSQLTTKTLLETQHEGVNSRQVVNPMLVQHSNNLSTATGYIALNTTDSSQPQQRKAPNSAHHSKKPSGNFIQPASTITAASSKRSTKEKYMELKAMYDDLLERHYAQQRQFSIINQGDKSQHPPINSQQMLAQHLEMLSQSSNTPRKAISSQLSQNNLNAAYLQQMEQQLNNFNQSTITQHQQQQYHQQQLEVIPKNLITLQQQQQIQKPKLQVVSTALTGQIVLQAKAVQKLNVAQGVSRKSVQGTHKRSVSDGNEQLFKFKQQQAMQRYLYPQPSNKTIQQDEDNNLVSNRLLHTLQTANAYQASTHQRRVSDDYLQKQKKHGIINQTSKGQRPPENIGTDSNPQPQKTQTADFNIKGFLLEMRNKHSLQPENPNHLQEDNMFHIQDEHQLHSYNPPSPVAELQLDNQLQQRAVKQFAMIIEENSPFNSQANLLQHYPKATTLASSRRVSGVILDPQPNASQRAHSPSTEVVDPRKKASASHKRVKSDVPEQPRRQNLVGKGSSKQTAPNSSQMTSKGASNPYKKSLTTSQQPQFNMMSDKTTPKRGTLASAVQKKQVFMFSGLQQHQRQISSQLDSSDNGKKVINVSIDLIKDAMNDNQNPSYLDESHDDSVSIIKKPQHHQQKQKPIVFSGGAITDSASKRDKYKKMFGKYQQSDAVPTHARKYTFDIGLSPSGCSPIASSPQSRFSINDKLHHDIGKKQQVSSKILMPNSPKQQQQIHMMMGKTKVKLQNLMPKKTQTPMLDKQQPAPNNSAVNTQESPPAGGNPSLMNTQVIVLKHTHFNIGERIETQDSTVSDPAQSPRTRANLKLSKHIRRTFRQSQQPPQTTVDFYRIGKVLGKGAFGKVNLALHKLSGKFAAVKSINKQYLSEETQTKKVMQEVVILKRTRHRNIVRLYEFFETQKHILFVIELCAGGDLLNYVRRRRRLKEEVAKVIFKQLIQGLDYCHAKSIVHRDIKLDNILLDSQGLVKICDFGVSKLVRPGEVMNEQCGTPAYIAPEILRDKGYEGFAVDLWSAGVVLYAMLYGTVPFKANNMSELQKMIMKAKYTMKDDVSEEARGLLKGLLEKDPSKRLKIPEIYAHQWLQDIDEDIQMFTEQEKETIKNEFSYSDQDRLNRNETQNANNANGGGGPHQDLFTEHMLDSTNNSMMKNCTTKSVILAPFNSTKSDINAPALDASMMALMQSKGCLKFAARVRDIDKQYEINNNAELDNGVYHKFEEEEKAPAVKPDHAAADDSLQSSFNKESSLKSHDSNNNLDVDYEDPSALRLKPKKKKSSKQTELEKLESLIIQQEDDLDHPYRENSPRHSSSMLKKDLHLQTGQTLIMDEVVVQQVEAMGYPKEYIVRCLNNNELNYATTGYYLGASEHAMSLKSGMLLPASKVEL